MTYQETLDYLFSQLPMYQRVGAVAFKKDLSNTISLCKHLGNPEKKYPVIHIAGTNGKGSSSHIIAGILQEHGLKTGLYTSPHYKDFRERVKVDGNLISEEAVIQFVASHKDAFSEIKPSFFEWTVALAFDHFAREQVDVALIEVGLGGRLDSTNVVHPMVSLITNIGFDHMQFLGDTLDKIAFEKAGIIKEGIPVVIGERHPETSPVFEKIAKERHAPLFYAEEFLNCEFVKQELLHTTYHFLKKEELWLDSVKVNLTGHYQRKNLISAIRTLLLLEQNQQIPELNPEKIKNALLNLRSRTNMIGRWEILGASPTIVADSAHNKEGLELAMAQLRQMRFQSLHVVLGAVNDKDLDKMLRLFPKKGRYYFARPDIPRGLDASTLEKVAAKFNLRGTAYPSVKEALAAAKNAAEKEDLIYVGGSTFVVAEVL
jgi:dihydrofolate synthase/folylpolyglutamate synthase